MNLLNSKYEFLYFRYTKVGFTNYTPERNLPGKGYVTIASVQSANPAQIPGSNDAINSINGDNNNSLARNGSIDESSSLDESSNSNLSVKDAQIKDEASLTGPKYVSLAHFKGQNTGEPSASVSSGTK